MVPASFTEDLAAARAREQAREQRRQQQRWKGHYSREAILDALRRWAAHHDKAPSRRDWSPAADPEHIWPRADKVAEVFGPLAQADGRRWFVHERCDPCACWDYSPERDGMRPFTPEHGCHHGDNGYWAGTSGWQYALELAGLSPRGPRDHTATASGVAAHGRNRQMVTGGAADQYPQVFQVS